MSSRFDIIDTAIAGLKIIRRKPIGDSRGYLERMFCMDELAGLLQGTGIWQINHTLTQKAGTLRGLHFQHPPHAEIKWVSCMRGEVFDVAVDLRRNSPTFLQYHAEVLSADNHTALYIPEGFAHGFQTLTEDCEMLYFHSTRYVPGSEGGLNAIDPQLAIDWPHPVTERSERDTSHPLLLNNFKGLEI
jgi:dTDP-4-dehydrorhamnose 3,5-epimerase